MKPARPVLGKSLSRQSSNSIRCVSNASHSPSFYAFVNFQVLEFAFLAAAFTLVVVQGRTVTAFTNSPWSNTVWTFYRSHAESRRQRLFPSAQVCGAHNCLTICAKEYPLNEHLRMSNLCAAMVAIPQTKHIKTAGVQPCQHQCQIVGLRARVEEEATIKMGWQFGAKPFGISKDGLGLVDCRGVPKLVQLRL